MTYKIILIGDAGSGKTAWVTRLTTGEYTRDYIPTENAFVTNHKETLNNGQETTFQLWDIPGNSDTGLGEGYYIGAHGAIIFLDGAKSIDERNVSYKSLIYNLKLVTNIPVCVVTTKCDIYFDVKVNCGVRVTPISARSCHHLDTPLRRLLKAITNNRNIDLASPEITLSIKTTAEYEKALQ